MSSQGPRLAESLVRVDWAHTGLRCSHLCLPSILVNSDGDRGGSEPLFSGFRHDCRPLGGDRIRAEHRPGRHALERYVGQRNVGNDAVPQRVHTGQVPGLERSTAYATSLLDSSGERRSRGVVCVSGPNWSTWQHLTAGVLLDSTGSGISKAVSRTRAPRIK